MRWNRCRLPFSVDERCHLGEGPTYDAATDTAWWFDILERRLFEARLGSGRISIHSLGRMASALARIDAKRQLDRRRRRSLCPLIVGRADDALPSARSGQSLQRVRTMPGCIRPERSGSAPWDARRRRGWARSMRCIAARSRCSMTGITIPNAICFSPDGAIGYFADTAKNVLFRVELDPATGLPRSAPGALFTRRGGGGIDGAVVDADGLIWNARWGGGCIDVYSPARRASAQPARSGAAGELSGFHRAGFLASAGHLGLAGHGGGREARRSRSWPHLRAGRRGARPPGTRRETRNGLMEETRRGKPRETTVSRTAFSGQTIQET